MPVFPFPGLNLAITTPFDASGRIDWTRLRGLVERYLADGIKGFVLSSGTGMHVYLSKEESKELAQRGSSIINGRAKIIVQTSALLVEEVIERTKHAADCGADGVMVLPPFFEGPTDHDDIVAFYSEAAKGGLPIIGYNVPQAVGVEITPSLIQRLCEIPNFHTVKDSSGDLGKQASLIRTGLPVINGADPLVPYALFAGARGLIWGGANIAPKSCLGIVEAAEAQNWQLVRERWKPLEPIMSLIWQGDYVQSVYAAAKITGYDAGKPRRPLRALPAKNMLALRMALGDLATREAA
ncbi:dihydrodipicolinate synthase family protein [Mesorhizobium sp.]|uniref:dihydrodipicolinate synthase family protein n=1 Tax=Mesorhizobium sp. TaxID=1871066 RepID=UPI000FEA96A0|nr:dihydrodipicolinate synthase family protein [Mesorhizobium sp.]RWO89889.1 MAG: dihydrodipicolinate synthase family protein [Mesorhizobium sp.]RWQ51974.1 MAG: dihydrodipicolinate synthase family protein [Mesorhizobium sp.]